MVSQQFDDDGSMTISHWSIPVISMVCSTLPYLSYRLIVTLDSFISFVFVRGKKHNELKSQQSFDREQKLFFLFSSRTFERTNGIEYQTITK